MAHATSGRDGAMGVASQQPSFLSSGASVPVVGFGMAHITSGRDGAMGVSQTPSPKCSHGHSLRQETPNMFNGLLAESYVNGWFCDNCKAKHATGNERWHCSLCLPKEDYCFSCIPKPTVCPVPISPAPSQGALLAAVQEENKRLVEQVTNAERENASALQTINDFRALFPHIQKWRFRMNQAPLSAEWNIRALPASDATVVGKIKLEETFLVEEEANGWVRVCCGGQRGWCNKEHAGVQYLHLC